MSSLRRDLIERRLWPLAVVLVAAIVAVPFLLAGHGHRSSSELADNAAPVPAAAQTTASGTTSTGAGTSTSGHAKGASSSRDPFAASGSTATSTTSSAASAVPDSGGGSTQTTSTSTPATTPAVSPSAGSGSSSGGAATVTTTTTVTTPAVAHHATATGPFTVYSADVRYTAPSAAHASSISAIARYTPLPAANWPRVMFMGLTSGGRDAVFALGAGVTARGKGICHPSHDSCRLISLRPGAAEKVSWPFHADAKRTMNLEVTRITKQVITDRDEAEAAIDRHSQIGLCELQLGDPIQYQYQPSGQLRSVSNSEPACTKALRKVALAFPGTIQEYGEVAVPGTPSANGQVALPGLDSEDGR